MPSNLRTVSEIEDFYKTYISQINQISPNRLDPFISSTIIHNDNTLTREEYHQLIIPESIFIIDDLLIDIHHGEHEHDSHNNDESDGSTAQIGARLRIRLSDGRVLKEFVFYKLHDGLIQQVWSMVQEVH